MESEYFRKFLEYKSSKVDKKKIGELLAWDEGFQINRPSKLSDFLELVYSEKMTSDLIVLERGTALDLVERIEWMEKNIERLNKKVKLLVVALILVSLLAAWGWLT
ncbi:MAG: hypothetical protein QXS21_02755 [Thermoproteota archaeon]|nr:hypothetical protein [Candidatus Brockarchaeota archaeon]MBO3801567.1 hypothetical protein [Candidatus Brockarchaeota archaeon]